jgi:hypothetical protein
MNLRGDGFTDAARRARAHCSLGFYHNSPILTRFFARRREKIRSLEMAGRPMV